MCWILSSGAQCKFQTLIVVDAHPYRFTYIEQSFCFWQIPSVGQLLKITCTSRTPKLWHVNVQRHEMDLLLGSPWMTSSFSPPPSVSIPSRLDIMLSSWIYHLNSISSRSELTIHQEPRASKALERLKIITSCLKLQSWQLQCQRSHVQDMQLKLWHWPNLSRWWVLCLLWWVILLFAKTFRFWWKRSPHPLSCIWDLYFTCSWPSTTHAAVHSCQTVKAVNITK